MTLQIGQTINNRYQIRQRIGAGGFGTTYLAWDSTHQRDVVIKESNTAADDEQTMLLEEIFILRKMKHSYLPVCYDNFFYGGYLYLVMQYIPGEDLSSYAFDPTIKIEQKIQWMCQVLEALSLLHQQQPHPIVHRDVKPDNIRIHEQTNDAYLIDFGIAKDTVKTKILAVSPPFSSPEQYTRRGTTPASDVYSVGIILYWMLTGSEPPEAPDRKGPLTFPAPQETTLQKVYQIITKATDLDPQNRYTSAQEMLQALQAVANDLGIISLEKTSVPSVPNTLPIQPQALPKQNLPSHLLRPLVSAGSVLIVLIVAGAIWGMQSRTTHPAYPNTPVETRETTIPTTVPSTPTPSPTITPTPTPAFHVTGMEVTGQENPRSLYVGRLPVILVVQGDALSSVSQVSFAPTGEIMGKATPLALSIRLTANNRLDLEISELPQKFTCGTYELTLNEQPVGWVVELHDYLEVKTVKGIKYDYRYLAGIQPLENFVYNKQTVPGPFGYIHKTPDETTTGGYIRNSDLMQILDETTYPDWYKVRVQTNFDPYLVGFEGWMLKWVVDDTPPAPPVRGAIQLPWIMQGRDVNDVMEDLKRRGVSEDRIARDMQGRDKLGERFDQYNPNAVVSSEPSAGSWLYPDQWMALGVRAPE